MRKPIFLICILICGLLIAADLIYSSHTAQQNRTEASSPGVYRQEEQTSPFQTDFYLCGEWEYYPGMLLYTNDEKPNFSHVSETINPTTPFNSHYDPGAPSGPMAPEVHTRSDIEELHRSAVMISVPFTGKSELYKHRFSQASSFRMVIENLAPINDFDMLISLEGLMYGDFEVYIDGNLVSMLVAPYEYPAYYFPVPESGSVEIVIQTKDTRGFLNITPRVSHKGIGMGDFDSYRIVLIIIAAVLFTAFIIMMVLIFSLDRKYLYLPFFIGLLFSANYLANNIWATGYLSSVTRIIPQYLQVHTAWLMLAGAIFLSLILFRQFSTGQRFRQFADILMIVCVISAAARLMNLLFPDGTAGILISDGCTLAVIILLLILSFLQVSRISRSDFLFLIGLFLMLTGALVSSIHNNFGFRNLFLYVQPLTIMAYMVLVFYNNKSNQVYLLKRTRELLELEKKSTQMQTAMLSSQIQPHFLYNTLTSIQELCYSDPDEAADLIVTFSQYLRSNLDFMNYEELVPFAKELEHIHNFMYIQNARYKDAIDYEEDLELTDFLIPPLSIEPIVENAVKHGIMKDTAKGHILLKIFVSDDPGGKRIHILVRNDGRKFNKDDLKPGHSMDNIKTRLKRLVNGELIFHFEDESPDTCVEVVIPYKES